MNEDLSGIFWEKIWWKFMMDILTGIEISGKSLEDSWLVGGSVPSSKVDTVT